jgi:molybdopterin molybdotransferase
MGLTARAGGTPVYLGIAPDNADKLKQLVARGLEADVLLLSGGVSAGKLDLVPGVLEEAGVTPVFHKVFMKPGKPLFFGTLGRKLVFGLPGNPVSTFAGFELFVRPALRVLMGYDDPLPRVAHARLQQAHRHQSDRPTYHPAVLGENAEGRWARPLPWFGSPDLRAVCAADGLCIFEAGTREFAAGETVPVLLLE